MNYMDQQIDESKLMKKDDVIQYLTAHGANYLIFSQLCERYVEEFDTDLIQVYRSDSDCQSSFYIMPVQEGFLQLPFVQVDSRHYDVIAMELVELLDMETLQSLLKAWVTSSNNLRGALEDMILIERDRVCQSLNVAQITERVNDERNAYRAQALDLTKEQLYAKAHEIAIVEDIAHLVVVNSDRYTDDMQILYVLDLLTNGDGFLAVFLAWEREQESIDILTTDNAAHTLFDFCYDSRFDECMAATE